LFLSSVPVRLALGFLFNPLLDFNGQEQRTGIIKIEKIKVFDKITNQRTQGSQFLILD
jgi:hypothetical protein